MKIGLIGYGKMGKEIEKILLDRGHEVPVIIDANNSDDIHNLTGIDVAIEFTTPETAFSNLKTCISQGVPVISGTTGWLEKRAELEKYCTEQNGAFFYASNFSLGVNLFFKLNTYLAQVMERHSEYKVSIEEVHHTEKKDKPSGTAICLAEQILDSNKALNSWKLDADPNSSAIPVTAKREKDVAGTHTITYESVTDKIEITHLAKSRKGFAMGAVLVAEWIAGKRGIFSMDDFLNIN